MAREQPEAEAEAPSGGGGGEDRLSALPDCILHDVLSFLKARQAVRTCALSTRWRRLWASAPCLDIDEREFFCPRSADELCCPRGAELKAHLRRFAGFTEGLLASHAAPCLDAFRLHVSNLVPSLLAQRWIRRGVDSRPAVLEISADVRRTPISGSTSLFGLPNLGGASCRLTRLHLVRASLDGSFAGQLKSGLPVLRDLKLIFCSCTTEFGEIASRTLRNLVMKFCEYHTNDPLIVAAPTLAVLKFAVSSIFNGVLPVLGSSTCCLTKLHFFCLCLPRGFAQQLSSGCPVLEELKLKSCTFQFHEIVSRTLKKLVMKYCTNGTNDPLIITAPNLAALCLYFCAGDNRHGILVTEMAPIVKASICVIGRRAGDFCKNMRKLLGKLTNVETLELLYCGTLEKHGLLIYDNTLPMNGTTSMQHVVILLSMTCVLQGVLHKKSNKFPTFHNMRTLIFGGCKLVYHIRILWHFLLNAPSLEKLTLWGCKFAQSSKRIEEEAIYLKLLEPTSFKCKNLKLIDIQHNDDKANEFFEAL